MLRGAGGGGLPLTGGTLTGALRIPQGSGAAPSLNFANSTTNGLSSIHDGLSVDFSIAGTVYHEMFAGTLYMTGQGGGGTGIVMAATGAADVFNVNNDTGVTRVSAGVVGIGTGASASVAGTLQLTTLTASGTVATGAPAGSSAGLWKLGALQTAAVVLDTTRSIFVDIGGTVYKLMVAQ